MTQPLSIELAESAAVTASGAGAAVDIGATRRALRMAVDVTSFTPVDQDPVPSVSVVLSTRPTTSAPWRTVDSVGVDAVGQYLLSAGGLDRYVRVSWSLTNMTSVTFSVTGEAHVVYADPADITRYAVTEPSIAEMTDTQRADACIAATDQADGYLNSSFELPITEWGLDLRQHVATLAAATLFRVRGADPAGPDALVFDAEGKTLKWFDRLANGRLKPPGIVDSTEDTFEGGSFVLSDTKRGW